MRSVSVGYYREDGDFAILATFNNKDKGLTNKEFQALVSSYALSLEIILEEDIKMLNREDAPDYVEIENEV